MTSRNSHDQTVQSTASTSRATPPSARAAVKNARVISSIVEADPVDREASRSDHSGTASGLLLTARASSSRHVVGMPRCASVPDARVALGLRSRPRRPERADASGQ